VNKWVTSALKKKFFTVFVAAMRNWIATGSEVVGQANRIPVTVSKSLQHKATRATRMCCGTLYQRSVFNSKLVYSP
jgi:hypothetical protein